MAILKIRDENGDVIELFAIKGDKGDTGPAGAKGEKGDTGAQGLQGEKGEAGADGYTPVKGTDYWTDADQESIVQQVISALGTPVFGMVDADKNIILMGKLTEGTYLLKYEDAYGTATEIGTITVGPTPDYTNMIPLSINEDGTPYNNGLGWKNGYRINSSGAVLENEGTAITGFIPATVADTLYFAEIGWDVNGTDRHERILFSDEGFNTIVHISFFDMYTFKDNEDLVANGLVVDEKGMLVSVPLSALTWWGEVLEVQDQIAYVRIVAGEITNASIITVNEPIA